MLKQYQELKSKYKDCILFFRLGDFYEMFYEDALQASPILDVVLTSRDAGKSGRIPMCGLPYHAKDSYIAKLIKKGFKVAICEQLEDPALAKGLVKRDVVRIITSGTFIDETTYDHRHLLSLNFNNNSIGIAFTDAISGSIQITQYTDPVKIIEMISKLSVQECIFPAFQEEQIKDFFKNSILKNKNILLSRQDDWCFNTEIAKKTLLEHFKTNNLMGFGIEDDMHTAISAGGALLEYLKQMNRRPMNHIDRLSAYTDSDYLFISPAAVYGLELENLFKAIDSTLTPFGKRCLKDWIYRPLKIKDSIINRQEAVTLLKNNTDARENLYNLLKNIPDIEKSLSRISSGDPLVKDLSALRLVISRLPEIKKALEPISNNNMLLNIEDLPYIRELITKIINPSIPLSNPEGKIVNSGYNSQLDELRSIQENTSLWLKDLQAREIKRTGINSLKIGYNHIFGYYIEITRANLSSAPQDYTRKQTLANAERFITAELKEIEEKMLNAQDNILKIEKEILQDLYKEILAYSSGLHQFTNKLAIIDTLLSLSKLADLPGYIIPEISDDTEIVIQEGRHPVVEKMIDAQFIPNDIQIDTKDNHLIIITGPNMAGKSTYIRQNALLVILSQMGSYIPAKTAKIGLVDKLFTRIGSHDDITKGQSTFMVEMNETASILNNLSEKSLVILDEIGRGTSTYDGLSLAWAISEYLEKYKTRTLFATHFHELTVLAEDFPGVKNYNVAVKEWNDEIVFLHKIIPGGTDESYGIYVAKLAGIPKEVLQRAKQILSRLELSGKLHDKIRNEISNEMQFSLFESQTDPLMESIKTELETLAINSLSPLSALNKLQEWKEKLAKIQGFTTHDTRHTTHDT